MTKHKQHKPPSHLRTETQRWFQHVCQEFDLESHHLRLLQLAGEAWDRGQQAREALLQHGLTYTDRHGQPRPRPEAAIERDNRIAFARLLRELSLDVSAPDDNRPPRIGANASLRTE